MDAARTSDCRLMPSVLAPSTAVIVFCAAAVVAVMMPALIQFAGAESLYSRADGQWLDFSKGLLWGSLIAATIPFWPIRDSMKMAMLWAWLLRMCVTLFVLLAFFHHYSGLDVYDYFAATKTVPSWEKPGLDHGTENIVALVWALSKVIPDSFHALNLCFALLSLIGVYWLWLASETFLGYSSRPLFYLLMLEPSLTFWTASIGKESIMTFALGLYAYGVVAWWRSRLRRHLFLAVAGLLIAGLIRTWMGGIMVSALLVLAYALERRVVSRIATTIVVVAVVYAAWPFILEICALQATQDLVEQVATISGNFNNGGSAGQRFAIYAPSDLIKYAPNGMFSALFRPLPGDVMNLFGLLASAEDLVILGLFVRAAKRTRLRNFKDPLILWMVALVVLWALIYAFISSQNFGTSVRYRVQILPIFLGLLLYLGRRQTLPRSIDSTAVNV